MNKKKRIYQANDEIEDCSLFPKLLGFSLQNIPPRKRFYFAYGMHLSRREFFNNK